MAADPGTRSGRRRPGRDKTQATISFGERPQNGGVQAQEIPGLAHVRGQRGGHVDHRLAGDGVGQDEPSGMQVQLGLDAAVGQHPVAFVFAVADDGMADQRHMGARQGLWPGR